MSEAKFGEPWQEMKGWPREIATATDVWIADFTQHGQRFERAIACVNVFEGIDDPEAELARLRKIEAAAQESLVWMEAFYRSSHPKRDRYDAVMLDDRDQMKNAHNALLTALGLSK